MEKRVDRRFDIPLRALLSLSNAPTLDLKTANISAGGAFFRTDRASPEGTEVLLTLFKEELPEENNPEGPGVSPTVCETEAISSQSMSIVKLKARIVRSYKDGMAISFDRYCRNE
ncbi:MAG: PilZ domain-containing protein [Desulfobulbaceae bacterium]|nr:PilZ domain-containing protein [Desulfobulbaceae bacterium]